MIFNINLNSIVVFFLKKNILMSILTKDEFSNTA